MKDILLVGGGGHCRSVIDVIECEKKFNIIGVIDLAERVGIDVLGYKVIGSDKNLSTLFKVCQHVLVTVGQIRSNKPRVQLFKKLKKIGFTLPVIVSPTACVSKYVVVGEGTIIMHHVLVNAGAKIGVNCIINSKALIEHDSIIGDNCHISTAAVINGSTKIGNNSFVGSNSVTQQEIQVVDDSFIKAGTVIK